MTTLLSRVLVIQTVFLLWASCMVLRPVAIFEMSILNGRIWTRKSCLIWRCPLFGGCWQHGMWCTLSPATHSLHGAWTWWIWVRRGRFQTFCLGLADWTHRLGLRWSVVAHWVSQTVPWRRKLFLVVSNQCSPELFVVWETCGTRCSGFRMPDANCGGIAGCLRCCTIWRRCKQESILIFCHLELVSKPEWRPIFPCGHLELQPWYGGWNVTISQKILAS